MRAPCAAARRASAHTVFQASIDASGTVKARRIAGFRRGSSRSPLMTLRPRNEDFVFHTHELPFRMLLVWPSTRRCDPNSSWRCGFSTSSASRMPKLGGCSDRIAGRLGVPRPSYSSVRRILIAERERKRRNKEDWDRFLGDILAGRVPYVTVEHKLVGVRGSSGRGGYNELSGAV